MIEELLSWIGSSYLNIGISTTAILLVLAALQGRRGLKYASVLGRVYKHGLVTLLVLGVLLAAGVITGLNIGRLVDLLSAALSGLMALL